MGTPEELGQKYRLRKRTMAILVVVCILVMCFFSFYTYNRQLYTVAKMLIILTSIYLTSGILLAFNRYTLSVLLMLVGANFSLLIFDNGFSNPIGTQYYYPLIILGAFLLLDKNAFRFAFLIAAMSVVGILLVNFTNLTPKLNGLYQEEDFQPANIINFVVSLGLILLLLNRSLREKSLTVGELVNTERNFSAIVENTTYGIWLVDRKFRIIAKNKVFDESLANFYQSKVSLGDELSEHLPKEVGFKLRDHYRKAIEGGYQKFEQLFYLLENKFAYAEFRFQLVTNEFGDITGIACYAQEITQRKISERKIYAQQERLKLAQKIAKMGSYTINLNTGQNSCSQEFYDLQEVESEEEKALFNGKIENNLLNSQWRFIHIDDQEVVQRVVSESIKHHRDYAITYRYPAKNGQIHYFKSSGSVVIDPISGSLSIFGTLQDVTEYKLAEEALAMSKSRLRSLIDYTTDSIYSLDAQGRLIEWNVAFAQRFKKYQEVEPWKGMVVWQNMKHEDSKNIWKSLLQKVKDEGAQSFHLSPNDFDYFEVNVSPVISETGQFLGATFYSRDISARVRAEAEKQSNERLLKSIYENVSEGIYRTNFEGKLLYCNPAFAEIFGYQPEEITGVQIKTLYTDSQQREAVRAKLLNEGFVRNMLVELLRKDGSAFKARINVNVNKLNEEVFFDGVLHDATKEIEFQNTLMKAKLEAEAAMKARTDFLSAMSHEIRTPMNVIMGLSSLVLEEHLLLPEHVLENLKAIRYSASNLLTIINDILDFSKMEAGKMSLEKRPFNLHELLKEMQITLSNLAVEKPLKVSVEYDTTLPRMPIGDVVRLNQILLNLCGNAIKFTHEGEVKLVVSHEEKAGKHWFTFKISDTGIGIPEDKLEAIFDSFSQVYSGSNKHFGGTGLGLTITKRLIALQEGKIQVESKEGVGSVFTAEIPFEISEEANSDAKNAEHGQLLMPDIRILVVDDNRMNLMLATQILKKWKCPHVTVQSGFEALDLLQKERFDLILLDLQMPGIDGFETFAQIRTSPGIIRPNVPVIALTADAFEETREKALQAGMNDFVTKPFQAEVLFAKIVELTNPLTDKPAIA